MDDLDIDELLDCDDIEQSAFINSSKYLLAAFDNIVNSIDERLSSKNAQGNYNVNSGMPNNYINQEDYN